MGNDKKIVEFIYIFFLLIFSEILFYNVVDNNMKSINYFTASRLDEDLNLMVCFEEKNAVIHNRIGRIAKLSIAEVPEGSPITEVIHKLFKAKQRFNIRIDYKANILHIYYQSLIPNYSFWLQEAPNRNLSPYELVKSLDKFYLPNKPMNQKLMSVLLYLGLSGQLVNKFFVLYEGMLIIINEHSQKFFFGIDFLSMPFNMVRITGVDWQSYTPNKFLISFKLYHSSIIFYTPDKGAYVHMIQNNSLRKRFTGFFVPKRDSEINKILENDDYERLVDMVNEKEIEEANSEIIPLLETLLSFGLFSIYFKSQKNVFGIPTIEPS